MHIKFWPLFQVGLPSGKASFVVGFQFIFCGLTHGAHTDRPQDIFLDKLCFLTDLQFEIIVNDAYNLSPVHLNHPVLDWCAPRGATR